MMTRKAIATVLLASALVSAAQAAERQEPAAQIRVPKIQVAILLDNSGSMGGLINQARAQLWKFINEFATTRKEGKIPEIEVALYIYGVSPTQILPLTNDLDLVSEKLFAVPVDGGHEYC